MEKNEKKLFVCSRMLIFSGCCKSGSNEARQVLGWETRKGGELEWVSLEPNLLCGSVRTRWRLLLTSNSYILLTSHGLTAPFCTTYREIVQKVCFGNPTTNKNVVTIYVNEMGERIQKWISIKLCLNTPMKKHEEAKDWKYKKKNRALEKRHWPLAAVAALPLKMLLRPPSLFFLLYLLIFLFLVGKVEAMRKKRKWWWWWWWWQREESWWWS